MRRLTRILTVALLAGMAAGAWAAATNPTIYTDQKDCQQLPSLKGVQNCRACLPNTNGNVWIVGQGCGKHPQWVSGTPVKTAADCQWSADANACNACVGGGSQYIVGSGCCADLNKRQTLTQGCVLPTADLCRKMASAQAGIACQDCIKSGKTFTFGYGCANQTTSH